MKKIVLILLLIFPIFCTANLYNYSIKIINTNTYEEIYNCKVYFMNDDYESLFNWNDNGKSFNLNYSITKNPDLILEIDNRKYRIENLDKDYLNSAKLEIYVNPNSDDNCFEISYFNKLDVLHYKDTNCTSENLLKIFKRTDILIVDACYSFNRRKERIKENSEILLGVPAMYENNNKYNK